MLVIWIVIFTFAVAWSIRDGRERDNQIQQNRVASCQRTYEGVREVFKPFFKPVKQMTPRELDNFTKFNRTVDRLKRRCSVQIKPPVKTTTTSQGS